VIDYITKPFELDELANTIEKTCAVVVNQN